MLLRAGVLAVLAVLVLATSAARASTYYVSQEGDDAWPGTSERPFASISGAAAVSRSGDTVEVGPGRYAEQVTLKSAQSGVTFRGQGRPVVDGANVHQFGFYTADRMSDVTVKGFEITGQTSAGVYLNGSGHVVRDNVVHHVGAAGATQPFGIRMLNGADHRVLGNTVHHIGPGAESMGIQLTMTRDAHVDGNVVYLVRKEGFRDFRGLRNRITNNRIFLCWTAVAVPHSIGTLVENNYLYDNSQGVNFKHTSDPVSHAMYGTSPEPVQFVRNTVFRSSSGSVVIGPNGSPVADDIQVRDNVFSDAALAFVIDWPEARGTAVAIDGNVYDSSYSGGAKWLYHTSWSASTNGYRTLAELTAALGWESSGRTAEVHLDSPETGDFDSGLTEGAHGLADAPVTWTPYPMTPIASTSVGHGWTAAALPNTADGAHHTYWYSDTNRDEAITYDFGQLRTIDHILLEPFSHEDKRAVRHIRFEGSVDGQHWTPLVDAINPDSARPTYAYALPAPSIVRFLRAQFVETFCDSYTDRSGCADYFVISDIRAGRLGAPGSGSLPESDLSRTNTVPATGAPAASRPPTASGAHPASSPVRTVTPAARGNATVPASRPAPVQPTASPAADLPQPSASPARFVRRAVSAPANGRLALRLACESACRGALRLARTGASRRPRWVTKSVRFRSPSSEVAVRMLLPADVRRALRRNGRVPLSARARIRVGGAFETVTLRLVVHRRR